MSAKRYRRLMLAVQAVVMIGALGLFQPQVEALRGAGELPTGGISDSAVIAVNGATMTVDGQRANNIIAWETFNVGQNATVAFGGTHNYLNYVKGVSPSEIYGTLTGGGNVYLVNPNGILFGESAQINVGHLYASTRNLTEADLSNFEGNGTLNPVIPDGGNVVNRMNSDLKNMQITIEGDVVTFANYKKENDVESTMSHTGIYDVKANVVNIGYLGNTEPTNLTNISTGNAKRNYCKLIGNEELSTMKEMNYVTIQWVKIFLVSFQMPVSICCGEYNVDYYGKYMLKENLDNKSIRAGMNYGGWGTPYSFSFSGIFDGAGHSASLNGEALFKNSSGDSELGSASVYNLTLTGHVAGDGVLGALAGTASGTHISGVVNQASMTGTDSSEGQAKSGGLFGFMDDRTVIKGYGKTVYEPLAGNEVDSGVLSPSTGDIGGVAAEDVSDMSQQVEPQVSDFAQSVEAALTGEKMIQEVSHQEKSDRKDADSEDADSEQASVTAAPAKKSAGRADVVQHKHINEADLERMLGADSEVEFAADRQENLTAV